jgi:hypothetical protein
MKDRLIALFALSLLGLLLVSCANGQNPLMTVLNAPFGILNTVFRMLNGPAGAAAASALLL